LGGGRNAVANTPTASALYADTATSKQVSFEPQVCYSGSLLL
jgi:hypothetical protein